MQPLGFNIYIGFTPLPKRSSNFNKCCELLLVTVKVFTITYTLFVNSLRWQPLYYSENSKVSVQNTLYVMCSFKIISLLQTFVGSRISILVNSAHLTPSKGSSSSTSPLHVPTTSLVRLFTVQQKDDILSFTDIVSD